MIVPTVEREVLTVLDWWMAMEGADVFHAVDLRAVEQIHKLAGVGRECLDVAALAFGVERLENKG